MTSDFNQIANHDRELEKLKAEISIEMPKLQETIAKLEKDVVAKETEIIDLRTKLEESEKLRITADSKIKDLEISISDIQKELQMQYDKLVPSKHRKVFVTVKLRLTMAEYRI